MEASEDGEGVRWFPTTVRTESDEQGSPDVDGPLYISVCTFSKDHYRNYLSDERC